MFPLIEYFNIRADCIRGREVKQKAYSRPKAALRFIESDIFLSKALQNLFQFGVA